MSTTTAEVMIENDRTSSRRQERLAERVRSLRTKAGGADGARALLIIGGIALPLGLVFIILGWVGASRTVNVFEQIPYAISGGLLGLALVFAGGFTYFAYWLTQLVYSAREEAADTRAILGRIEEYLAAASLANQAAAEATAVAPATVARREVTTRAPLVAADEIFLATASGTMYHRPDCQTVAGRDGTRTVTGTEPGLTACRICAPDVA